MAVSFGDTMFDGGIAPEVQVQSPVQDDSGAVLAQGFGKAAEVAGNIFGGMVKAGQDGQSNAVLTSYRTDLLKLADVAEQRGDSAAVRMRARALYSQYLANNPSLSADLDKVNSELLGANGLAHIINEGSTAAKAQEAITTAAITGGWVADPNDPNQVSTGVANYQAMQVDVQKANALQTQLTTITAQGGIIDGGHKQEAQQIVRNLGKSGYPWVKSQIDTARAQLDAGGNAAEILAKLKSDYAEQSALYTTLAEGQDMAWVLEPMNQLITNFEAYATGSVETGVYDAQNKAIKARQEFALRSDEQLGPLLVASELLGANSPSILARTTKATNDFFGKSIQPYDEASDSNPKPNDPVGGKDGDVKAGLDLITEGVKKANGNASTPAVVDEAGNAIINTVRGISAYSGSAESAKDYKDVVNWLATPDIGTYMETNGGAPTAIAEKASKVIQVQYEEVLLPLVKERWDSAVLSIPDPAGGTSINSMGSATTPNVQIKASEVIEPVWNGTSVQFIPKPGYENNVVVAGTARSMNTGSNSLAEPLNTLIRAKAHLNGGKDYQKEWEGVFGDRLFGIGDAAEEVVKPTEKPAETSKESETLSMFNEETEASQQASVLQDTSVAPITPEEVNSQGVNFDSYLKSIRSAESGGNDNAQNPTSTATGRYQFLKSTWNDLVNRYPNAGLSADGRFDAAQQETAIRLFTGENARALTRSGISINNGNLYAAHFLGAGDASKVLTADDDRMVSDYVPARVISANGFLRGMTVAAFKTWAARKGNK